MDWKIPISSIITEAKYVQPTAQLLRASWTYASAEPEHPLFSNPFISLGHGKRTTTRALRHHTNCVKPIQPLWPVDVLCDR